MIAAPRFIGRKMMKPHPFQRCLLRSQQLAHPGLHLGIPNIDLDLLHLYKLPYEFRIDGRNRPIFVRETDPIGARPRQPRRGMRLPFCRHSITELSWRLHRSHGSRSPLATSSRRYHSSCVNSISVAFAASRIVSGLVLPRIGMIFVGCFRSHANAIALRLEPRLLAITSSSDTVSAGL